MSENTTYFVLSRVSAFESGGFIVVDRQNVREYGTEEEVEVAFNTLSLPDFAAEYGKQLRPDERLVAVSKIVSLCDAGSSSTDIIRDDYKLTDNMPKLVK